MIASMSCLRSTHACGWKARFTPWQFFRWYGTQKTLGAGSLENVEECLVSHRLQRSPAWVVPKPAHVAGVLQSFGPDDLLLKGITVASQNLHPSLKP
jgi:hypothetical protein